ncbi:MAG: UDP-N-acetylmuramate dehydrogenase, partial [Planctomycetota bacterium]
MSLTEGMEHIVRENEPLAPYTRLKLGGIAEYFAEPTTEQELSQLVKRFAENDKPVRLIGGGSNILVKDEGVPGLVICLSAPEFCQCNIVDDQIHASGGTRLKHFVSMSVREGFAGPENLVGIPGTVGGALHGNTGVNGYDIGSGLQSARVMTRQGEILERKREDFSFAYRQSSLDELAILDAQFAYEKEDPSELTKRMQKLWIVRRAAQPVTETSIYVFKDHGVESAADLIEQAGLKGTRVGEVEISDRDANTFVTHPGAVGSDVLRLIDLARDQVADKLGVEIETSIEI